jgi:hypothetical protein
VKQRHLLLDVKERLAQIADLDTIAVAYAASPAVARSNAKPRRKINILSLDGVYVPTSPA